MSELPDQGESQDDDEIVYYYPSNGQARGTHDPKASQWLEHSWANPFSVYVRVKTNGEVRLVPRSYRTRVLGVVMWLSFFILPIFGTPISISDPANLLLLGEFGVLILFVVLTYLSFRRDQRNPRYRSQPSRRVVKV